MLIKFVDVFGEIAWVNPTFVTSVRRRDNDTVQGNAEIVLVVGRSVFIPASVDEVATKINEAH